jgi:hypothetical protein
VLELEIQAKLILVLFIIGASGTGIQPGDKHQLNFMIILLIGNGQTPAGLSNGEVVDRPGGFDVIL